MKNYIENSEIIERLSKYTSLPVLRKEDLNLYQLAQRRGLHEYIPKKQTGEKRKGYKNKSDDEIIEQLKKYSTIRDIRKKEPGLYHNAIKRKLNKYLPDKITCNGNKIYTDDEIIEIINSYSSRKEFITENKRLNAIICTSRRHLIAFKNLLPYSDKIVKTKKEKRPKLIYKNKNSGTPNVLTKYRKICLTIDDEKIYIGNWVDDETKLKIIKNGYSFILK